MRAIVLLAFSLAISVATAHATSFSTGRAQACDYDALGPGGVYQGQADPFGIAACDGPHFALDGAATANVFATIHPGLSGENGRPSGGIANAVPGNNNSWVDAIAYNGGGATATGTLGYDIINRRTRNLDSGALVTLTVSAYADAGGDKFKVWNNAGYELCVGSVFSGGCSFASASGAVNNNNGLDPNKSQYYTFNDNQMRLGFIVVGTTALSEKLTFSTSDGTVLVTESAYANLTSEADVDPTLVVDNPDDELVPLSSFTSDPNTPLFTAAQLSLMQSYGIDTSGLPGAVVTPEPSSVPILVCAFAVYGLFRSRRWCCRPSFRP